MHHDGGETREKLIRFFRRQELLVTVLLCCLHAGLSVWRVGERAVWLLRDFKPLRIPYETEWMAVHEGGILLAAAMSVWMAAGCVRLYLTRGRPRVGVLHAAAAARMWLGRLLGLLCLAAAGGVTWLAYYYRVSVSALGWIGIIFAVLLFCCVTRVRFWRNITRILKDARGKSDDGVTGCLRFQSLTLMAVSLLPLLMVLLEDRFAAAVADTLRAVLPLVTADTVKSLMGETGGMYATDLARTAAGALACGMVYFLYGSYRASYGDSLTGRLQAWRSRRKGKAEPPKALPPRKDPGRRPWGKGV